MNKTVDDVLNELALDTWPQEGLEAVHCCPVCGESKRKVLYQGLTDRVFRCAPGEWTLYECQVCGSGYLNPRPKLEMIGLAYRSYFTHQSWNAFTPSQLQGIRRIRHKLANGYRNWRYGGNTQPASYLGVIVSGLMPVHRRRINANLRYLPRYTTGGRLLDVGCGNGGFLQAAKAIGWDVYGADPDPVAVAVAQKSGIDVRLGGIESFDEYKGFFDVVTLNHVIEHVHEPYRLIEQCFTALKPGGQLFLETPNMHSLGHKYFAQNWLHLDPPRHLVIFNWYSLELVLSKSGFVRLERKPCGDDLSTVSPRSRSIKNGKPAHIKIEPNLWDRFQVGVAEIVSWGDYNKRECVSLIAFKPD